MPFKLEGLRILVRVRIGNHNDLKKSTVLKLKIIDRNRVKLGLGNPLKVYINQIYRTLTKPAAYKNRRFCALL